MNRINTRLNIIARVIAMMVIVLSPAVLSAQCGGGSASWCTPSIVAGPTPYNMGISNVTFGSINNTTSNPNYTDYSNLSTAMSAGGTQSISIGLFTGYPQHCMVWIDWNNDGTFS